MQILICIAYDNSKYKQRSTKYELLLDIYTVVIV